MADPVVTFRFSTTPMFSGTTIRVYNTGTNWVYYVPGSSSTVTLTLSALDGGAIFLGATTSFTKSYTTNELVGDFTLDLLASEVFAGAPSVIPDDIINFKIDIAGSTSYTFDTDEVFYYNSWAIKTNAAYKAVDFIEDVNSREIKYACMVNALYQGLTADIFVGNTSGIYEKFDIFNRLAQ
jgi:hypothetical protein